MDPVKLRSQILSINEVNDRSPHFSRPVMQPEPFEKQKKIV